MQTNEVIDRFLQCCAIAYHPSSSNLQRRQALLDLEAVLAASRNPDAALEAAVILASGTVYPPEARSCALSQIVNMVRTNYVPATSIPLNSFIGLLSQGSEDGGATALHPLVVSGVAQLISLSATRVWPLQAPGLLDRLCPENLDAYPALLTALEAFVTAVYEPQSIPNISVEAKGAIRREIVTASREIIRRCVIAAGSIFSRYVEHRQRDPVTASRLCTQLSRCVTIVQLLLPLVTPINAWFELYVHDMMAALMGAPTEDIVLAACGLWQCMTEVAAFRDDAANPNVARCVALMCENASKLAALGAWEPLRLVMEATVNMDSEVLRLSGDAPILLIRQLLQVPSILLGNLALELFCKHPEPNPAILPPEDLLNGLFKLCRKFATAPNATGPAAGDPYAQMSRAQFSSVEEYDQAFAAVRNQSALAIAWLARAYPSEALQAASALVTSLPTPTAADERTRFGHVVQRSAAYIQSEATAFIVEHLNITLALKLTQEASAAVKNTIAHNTAQLLVAVAPSVPSDATLLPVFLNTCASFWPLANPSHWPATLQLLFTVAQIQGPAPSAAGGVGGTANVNFDDIDLLAARKRGLTLLIRACVDFPAQVGEHAVAIIDRAQTLLLQGRLIPSEMPFMFEACVASCVAMPVEQERERLIRRLLESRFVQLQELMTAHCTSGARLSELLVGTSENLRGARSQLKETLSIVTTSMRRCPQSAFVLQATQLLLPLLGQAAHSILSLPQCLPAQFQCILDIDEAEKASLQTGARREPVMRNPTHQARSALTAIRNSVFQGIGACITLVKAVPQFIQPLCDLMNQGVAQSLQTMRALCEQCLFPSMISYPPLAQSVLPCVGRYIFIKAQRLTQLRNERDEIAESKQLLFFFKDTQRTLRTAFLPQPPQAAGSSGGTVEAYAGFRGAGHTGGGAAGGAGKSGAARPPPDTERLQSLSTLIDPVTLQCVVKYLWCVVASGIDFQTASRDLMSIFQLEPAGAPSETAIVSAAAIMACCVCNSAAAASAQSQQPSTLKIAVKDVDMILSFVCADWYVRHFPLGRRALAMIGMPEEAVATMDTDLSMTARNDAKRQKFKAALEHHRQFVRPFTPPM